MENKGVGNLDASGGIKHGDGPVEDAECPLHLQSEINVSCSETVKLNTSGFTSPLWNNSGLTTPTVPGVSMRLIL